MGGRASCLLWEREKQNSKANFMPTSQTFPSQFGLDGHELVIYCISCEASHEYIEYIGYCPPLPPNMKANNNR